MSVENPCPECGNEMEWDNGEFVCATCNDRYKKILFCPTCEAELEKLASCGAANYFCNSCNELKSKTKARIEFRKL